jgi:phytol kinase
MGLQGWVQQLAGCGAVALWLALLAAAALQLRRHWPEQREWSRKLVHIGTGAVAPLAWLFAIDRWIAIPTAATITVLAALNHRYRLLPAIEDVGRHSYGTVAYGASITLLLALFWPERAAALCAGVLVMAFGDGLAGLLGPLLGSPSWRVLGQRRSLAGTLTMGLVSLLVLAVLAALVSSLGEAVPSATALLVIAASAMALEQIGWAGIDNLSVPVAVALLWQGFSG